MTHYPFTAYSDLAIQLLQSIAPLPAELSPYLQKRFVLHEYNAKEYMLRKGDSSDRLHFIAKGLVRVFTDTPSKLGPGNKEICNWFLMEGDVAISVESFFSQSLSEEFIQALEPTITVSLSRTELDEIYRIYPAFNYHGRILTQRYYIHAVRQLKCIRYKKADDSYQCLQEQFPELLQRVPARYLASYLGVNATYISTLRNRIRSKR